MDSRWITLLLLLGIVVVIIPKSIKKTLYILALFVLVVCVLFSINQLGNMRTISIRATDTKNELAEGTEIWLKEVIVNGEDYLPIDYFGTDWILEDGILKWRNYDQSQQLKNTIKGKFNNGDQVQLIFYTNRWRGIVEITSWNGTQIMDCYSETDLSDSVISFELPKVNVIFNRIGVNYILSLVWLGLIVLGGVYNRINKKKKDVIEIKKQGSRILSFDILKIISAYMIALIHIVGVIYNSSILGSKTWIFGLTLNVIPRFAVPVFIMISGVFILKKEEIPLRLALNRAKTAIIALLMWGSIYVIIQYLYNMEGDLLNNILLLVFRRGPSGHLWFSYFIVWMYLLSPILVVLYKKLNDEFKKYIIVIILFIPSIWDTFSLVLGIDFQRKIPPYYSYIHLGYIGMLFLGAYIYENKERYKISLGVFFLILGFSITFILSYFTSINRQISQFEYFDDPLIGNILYALGVFILACKFSTIQIDNFIGKVLIKLSELSLGVYFSHAIFVEFFNQEIRLGDYVLNANTSAVACIILAFVCYIFGVITSWSMSQIPYLRKVVKF